MEVVGVKSKVEGITLLAMYVVLFVLLCTLLVRKGGRKTDMLDINCHLFPFF